MARLAFHVPGKWGLTLMSMEALQVALPATTVFMGPAIAGLTVHIHSPLPPLFLTVVYSYLVDFC